MLIPRQERPGVPEVSRSGLPVIQGAALQKCIPAIPGKMHMRSDRREFPLVCRLSECYTDSMEERNAIEVKLAASLKSLAVRHPFEKITIKQITDGAGVIRVTFYNHFQDKYDLLEWIMRTEILEPVRILLANSMFREAVVLIFRNMQKDKDFYMHIVNMEGQNSFSEMAERGIEEILRHAIGGTELSGKGPNVWISPEFVSKYYAKAMTFVVVEWIRTGMTISPEEMAEGYEYIATRSLEEMVGEMRTQ